MKLSRKAVLLLACAIVAVVLVFAMPPSGKQTVKLSDGTILTLEKVTYGKKHRFIRFELPLNYYSTYQTTRNDGLGFFITRRDPDSGQYLRVPWRGYFAVDEHGCRFENYRTGQGSSGGIIVARGILEAFPRTGKEFKLVILKGNDQVLAEFRVPIPRAALGRNPIWTLDSLPVTKHVGDLAVTLTEIGTYRRVEEINGLATVRIFLRPTFRFEQNGVPTSEWQHVYLTTTTSTGNLLESYPHSLSTDTGIVTGYGGVGGVCDQDSAWRIRTQFFRSDSARFATGETWRAEVSPVTSPATVQRLEESGQVGDVTIQLLAIAGSGEVSYPSPGKGIGGSSRSFSRNGIQYMVQVNTDTTGGTTVATVTAPFPHVAARFQGLTANHRVSVNVTDDRDRDVQVVTQISSEDKRFWFLDIPQDSKSLRLVVAVHQGRTVEFIVKPPRPPSARE